MGSLGVNVVLPFMLTVLWVGLLGSDVGGDIGYLLPAGALAAVAVGGITYHAALQKSRALLTILILCLVITPISFRIREQGAVGLDMQNGVKVLLWFMMLAVGAVNIKQFLVRLYIDPALAALAAFSLIALITSIYSPVPALTAMSSLSLIAFLGFAVLLVANVSFRRISLAVITVLAIICILNLVSAVALPDIAYLATDSGRFRFRGISGHPNTLARQAELFTMLLIASYYRGYIGRATFLLTTVLAVGTMLATEARTAIIGLVIPVVVCLGRRFILPIVIVAAAAAVLVLASGETDTLLSMIGRGGDASEAMSMAGRTDLWQFVLDQTAQQPWFGHGYNSFESVATEIYYGQNSAAAATHNNYLEVLYSTGIVGGVPFFTAIAILLYRWITQPYPPRDLIVLNAVISSFTEVDITTIAVLPTLLIFIVLARDSIDRGMH
jgi:O-antigen ligase